MLQSCVSSWGEGKNIGPRANHLGLSSESWLCHVVTLVNLLHLFASAFAHSQNGESNSTYLLLVGRLNELIFIKIDPSLPGARPLGGKKGTSTNGCVTRTHAIRACMQYINMDRELQTWKHFPAGLRGQDGRSIALLLVSRPCEPELAEWLWCFIIYPKLQPHSSLLVLYKLWASVPKYWVPMYIEDTKYSHTISVLCGCVTN